MANGFLGYDASLMLDVVVCALLLVVPVLAYSIYVVRARRRYVLHRNLQVGLGALLLVTVIAFEVDMRMQGGWELIVNKPEAEPRLNEASLALVRRMLWVHLLFAVTTPILWLATLCLALARFPNPPRPAGHSRLHKVLGWASAVDIALTSVTGLAFYYAAFVASW